MAAQEYQGTTEGAGPAMATMARRSVLFSPGDRPELMRKAAKSGADLIAFDLEDGVAPARKDEARDAVNEVLRDIDPDCEVCVRVNPAGIAADDDLDAILAGDPRIDSVMLPKVESADATETLQRLLDEHGVSLPILAVVETAAGVLSSEEIATARAVDALLFGAEDLSADIGATRTEEGEEVLYARQRVVMAASAGGVDAIDTLYTDFEDTDGLRADARRALEMGYDGKMAIHPDQVPVINDAFTPSEQRVEWARKVLTAREQADVEDRGVFTVEGEMIDAPLVAQAERILDRSNDM
jgi:citrate lyase subunit beta/citryl-CoA lyase